QYQVNFIPNNVNKDINANIFITFNYKDLTKTYLVSNYNLKNTSFVNITCTVSLNCNSDSVELISAIAEEDKLNFAKIAEGEKISIHAENLKLNFINLKLK